MNKKKTQQLSPFIKWLKTLTCFFLAVEDGVMTDDSTVVCIHGFPTSSYDWIKVHVLAFVLYNICAVIFFNSFC